MILDINKRSLEIEISNKKYIFEIGEVAKQADASTLVKCGGTVVLVTCAVSKEPKEGQDFLPLVVDYEEKLYAVGKIPGGFYKREGKPTDEEILKARLVDRSLRPLFPEFFFNDVQIIAMVLSQDKENPADILALNGASLALSLSSAPFLGPVGAVRVGKIGDRFIINPTFEEIDQGEMDIVIAGTEDYIVMVEAGLKEVKEEDILKALEIAHDEIKNIARAIKEFAKEHGKEKIIVEPLLIEEEIIQKSKDFLEPKFEDILENFPEKTKREEELEKLKEELFKFFITDFETKEEFSKEENELIKKLDYTFTKILKEYVRKRIIEKNIRVDGRRPDEIRPLYIKVGLLPQTHGSGLFTRGQTQVLSVVTLGGLKEGQLIEGLEEEFTKRYMHYYNFPPFSTGEVKPLRGPSRREIGHGALAERALLAVIPDEVEFPYSIRVVSEVLESNGSTSMASVCGSTLALMDAGVPIKRPVSGIAMGLIKEGDKYTILSDIQGMEDHLGDMDFKVAGTEVGVTALQMDIKIKGIDLEIIDKALRQAKEGRLYILSEMLKVIDKPRPEISPLAPRVIVMEIEPIKIKDVIGPQGKFIKKIIDETNVKIDIEPTGRIYITAPDYNSGEKAREMIKELTQDIEVGRIYLGKVLQVREFGLIVELTPNKDGLLHVSQMRSSIAKNTKLWPKVGDEIIVKVANIDDLGRVNLTQKGIIFDDEDRERRKDKK
ncbi:MAG: polyribonucleotide nucleotidyltransferase [Caldisericia bacterium]|jgi:polyribonucleotide nucleotidyltransferase|nr:polyribonucleotide nucleotidyltransferase [Caldisericia bacterium]